MLSSNSFTTPIIVRSNPSLIETPESAKYRSPLSRRICRCCPESDFEESDRKKNRSRNKEDGKTITLKNEKYVFEKRYEKGTQTIEKWTRIHLSTRNVGVKTGIHKITFGSCGRQRCRCCPFGGQSRNQRFSEEKTDPEKTVTSSCGVQTTPTTSNKSSSCDSSSTNDSNKRSGTFKGVFELEEPNLNICKSGCTGDCSRKLD